MRWSPEAGALARGRQVASCWVTRLETAWTDSVMTSSPVHVRHWRPRRLGSGCCHHTAHGTRARTRANSLDREPLRRGHIRASRRTPETHSVSMKKVQRSRLPPTEEMRGDPCCHELCSACPRATFRITGGREVLRESRGS